MNGWLRYKVAALACHLWRMGVRQTPLPSHRQLVLGKSRKAAITGSFRDLSIDCILWYMQWAQPKRRAVARSDLGAFISSVGAGVCAAMRQEFSACQRLSSEWALLQLLCFMHQLYLTSQCDLRDRTYKKNKHIKPVFRDLIKVYDTSKLHWAFKSIFFSERGSILTQK